VAADVQAEPESTITVRRLRAVGDREIEGLADVLVDCVDGGASISFMRPLSREKALAFWRGIAGAVERGERALLVAEDVTGILGTVQLVLDLPENQPHRAELSKMIVHRSARRRGVGAALLRAAEDTARECGRWLLVLDTASGDAERLYAREGWVRVGVVPDYALLPDGALCATTFFYRRLDG
jgi:GNAT superfamily N-acetyltransferase